MDDAITYLLHRTHSHLDKGKSAVRIMFFDFSSAFNTIQPLRLGDKLLQMGVDAHLVSWITDYLTGRPQYFSLKECLSDTVVCSTGAPQGTVLSPVLFTLYTSDFCYNTESHAEVFGRYCDCGVYQGWAGGGVKEPGGGVCAMVQTQPPTTQHC